MFVAAKGTYASLFFCILKTDYDALLKWPFCHKLTFSILDQRMAPPFTPPGSVVRENYVVEFTPNPVQENKAFIGRPTGFRNSSFGESMSLEKETLRVRDVTEHLTCIHACQQFRIFTLQVCLGLSPWIN